MTQLPARKWRMTVFYQKTTPSAWSEMQKAAQCGLQIRAECRFSALPGFETRVTLADYENLTSATDDLAVAVPGLGRFERRKHLHDNSSGLTVFGRTI